MADQNGGGLAKLFYKSLSSSDDLGILSYDLQGHFGL